MEEATFVDRHGVGVFTRCWPVDALEGVVLIAHGASEHSARYERFAHSAERSRASPRSRLIIVATESRDQRPARA